MSCLVENPEDKFFRDEAQIPTNVTCPGSDSNSRSLDLQLDAVSTALASKVLRLLVSWFILNMKRNMD